MNRRLRAACVAILFMATGVVAQRRAQPQMADGPPQDRALKPLSDAQVFLRFDQLIEGGQTTTELRARLGNQHGDPNNYANSVFVSTGTSCTATLVGPRALITAQHCVIGSGPLTLAARPKDATAWCVKYLDYSSTSSQDLALCWIERDMPPPYESIKVAADLKKDATLALAGYGLTGRGGSAVGKEFVLGMATVTEPGPDTIVTMGGASVRIGDSGGPGFFVTPDKTRRFLVGVTKQESLNPAEKKKSYLTALAFQEAREFLAWWPKQQLQVFQRTVLICGLDNIAGCQ
jgi:Trypsin